MVEEVGGLGLGDGLPEGKPQESYYSVNVLKMKMRMPWWPLYRVRCQCMYKEGGSPDRGVVSLREGPIYLGLQATPSCGACLGMVVIMVLCPCHSKVWCGATVLAMAAPLAQWWFISHPA